MIAYQVVGDGPDLVYLPRMPSMSKGTGTSTARPVPPAELVLAADRAGPAGVRMLGPAAAGRDPARGEGRRPPGGDRCRVLQPLGPVRRRRGRVHRDAGSRRPPGPVRRAGPLRRGAGWAGPRRPRGRGPRTSGRSSSRSSATPPGSRSTPSRTCGTRPVRCWATGRPSASSRRCSRSRPARGSPRPRSGPWPRWTCGRCCPDPGADLADAPYREPDGADRECPVPRGPDPRGQARRAARQRRAPVDRGVERRPGRGGGVRHRLASARPTRPACWPRCCSPTSWARPSGWPRWATRAGPALVAEHHERRARERRRPAR